MPNPTTITWMRRPLSLLLVDMIEVLQVVVVDDKINGSLLTSLHECSYGEFSQPYNYQYYPYSIQWHKDDITPTLLLARDSMRH